MRTIARIALLLATYFAHSQSANGEDSLAKRIDQLIAAKATGPFASRAADDEFMRRVYLDLAGRIPSVSDARAFLADANAEKRTQLIDRLLASPEYAQRMADQFHIMLMERLGDHDEWTQYLTKSFQSNKPWDLMVKEMIYADSENPDVRGAAFFLSKRLENYGQNPVDYPGLVRDVGRLFLGIDVQCAQCHDHLFIDDYKQQDYQGLFAFLGQSNLRQDVKFPAVGESLVTKKVAFKSVFVPDEKMTGPRLPGGTEIDIPTFAKGEEYRQPPDQKTKQPGVPKFSPLQVLSQQLPRAENDRFKKNIVNRAWWMLLGRGLVHPLDLHHKDNPASHPELLDLLAAELANHQFDLKWLFREIALSDAYQRSSMLPEGSTEVPAESFRVFLEKPLSAEQLVACVAQATGSDARTESLGNELRSRFLKAYANPPREPEGEHAPTLKAALFLMNDPEVLARFQAKDGNLVERLSKRTEPTEFANELYLAILTRAPSEEEINDVREYLGKHGEHREKAISQLAWSLLASIEFSVNH